MLNHPSTQVISQCFDWPESEIIIFVLRVGLLTVITTKVVKFCPMQSQLKDSRFDRLASDINFDESNFINSTFSHWSQPSKFDHFSMLVSLPLPI